MQLCGAVQAGDEGGLGLLDGRVQIIHALQLVQLRLTRLLQLLHALHSHKIL